MSPSQISVIESNKSRPSLRTAIAIARALDTSIDFLTGVIDDPRPATEILERLRSQETGLLDPSPPAAVLREDERSQDAIAIVELDTVAGGGSVIHVERILGQMTFPVRWLRREGLNAEACRIIRVVGEAMEPTLPGGCSVLVDYEKTRRRDGKIFVIRTRDELLVGRTLRKKTGWLLASDNTDKNSWPTRRWPVDARIVGEVRWVWYSLP